jgi:hypothetical protein
MLFSLLFSSGGRIPQISRISVPGILILNRNGMAAAKEFVSLFPHPVSPRTKSRDPDG